LNSPKRFKEHGVTHILSLASTKDCPKVEWQKLGIEALHLEIEDNPYEDILICLEGVYAWMDHALSEWEDIDGRVGAKQQGSGLRMKERKAGERATTSSWTVPSSQVRRPQVLVHCIQGISRSGAVVVAFLMRRLSLSYDAALEIAKVYRPIIAPNTGFSEQLRLWQQWDYSIFKRSSMLNAVNSDKFPEIKDSYQEWRENRGILLSKVQSEKREALMDLAVELIYRFQ
jgi:dual specificity phosphatase 12